MDSLGLDDRALLDFESCVWLDERAKIGAIGLTFGLRPSQYYARLALLLGDPGARKYAPEVAARLGPA